MPTLLELLLVMVKVKYDYGKERCNARLLPIQFKLNFFLQLNRTASNDRTTSNDRTCRCNNIMLTLMVNIILCATILLWKPGHGISI